MKDTPSQETTSLACTSSARELRLKAGELVVVDGPDAGRRFTFRPPRLKIGSREDNDVVLATRTVSRYHATIDETPSGFLLRDLNSRNGTYVDDVCVKEAYLAHGSTIRLGAVVLRFEPPSSKTTVAVSQRSSFGEVLGVSPRMRHVFGMLEKVAATELTVLITGETGTGKEVVVRSIHAASPRSGRPFIVVDCSAIPRELMESTLLGHREGAFTGAIARRTGALLSADGGTLFLDEVGELALELQPKLLRVLERREVQPLGSDRTSRVDVRVVAATNRNLKDMVRHGLFRQDLFYRLSTVEVALPPLRDRPEDIPLLVKHFLEQSGAPGRQVTPAAMQALARAPWAGNIRELKNVIERTLAFAGGAADSPIDREHLMLSQDERSNADLPGAGGGDRSLEEIEATAILATLRRTSWNKSQASRILGITRNTLQGKIQRYGLKP